MAGYFYYLGRVFTEKGSWYKILTIVALQAIIVYFNPKDMFQGATLNLNVPAIILYLLASWLIFGFSVQIYSNSLNGGLKILPDLDFGRMFMNTLRFIPFSLVWGIYMVLFGVIAAMIMPALRNIIVLAAIPVILVLIVLMLILPVLMAIHAKNFSYKHVLNPLTPFRIFRDVAGPVALLDLTIALVSAVLYGLTIGGAVLIGVSGGISGTETTFDPVSAFTLGLLLIIFFYVQNAIGFAYSLKLCDIIKSRLAETEYMDDDFDSTVDADEDEDY